MATTWYAMSAAVPGPIPASDGNPKSAPVPPWARPSDTARITYKTMSSATATPSTTRANGVSRMPRSCMILEITGMLVTAMAIAKMSRNEAALACGPHEDRKSRTCSSPSPARKGRTVPVLNTQPTVLFSPRRWPDRIWAPEQNSNKSRPSW